MSSGILAFFRNFSGAPVNYFPSSRNLVPVKIGNPRNLESGIAKISRFRSPVKISLTYQVYQNGLQLFPRFPHIFTSFSALCALVELRRGYHR